jgi:hypothetical protein
MYSLQEIDHLEDLGVDGRVSLKSVLKKQAWQGVYTIYLARYEVMASCCEHGNEP